MNDNNDPPRPNDPPVLDNVTQRVAHWMVRKFGAVYLHETVIAHVRELLDGRFAHSQLHETPGHFTQRMQKVEDYMNSSSFTACGGRGLTGLAKDLRTRCEEARRRQGERIPT